MTEHTSTIFDQELRALSQKIATMGGLAERSLSDSIAALIRRDKELAQSVIDNDQRVDTLEKEVEELAILTIAKRAPVARDLRAVIAAIRISGDLERIGDLTKNIAKRVLAVEGVGVPQSVVLGLEHMSETALVQLKDVLDAYVRQNNDLALEVWRRDDEIDSMYTSLFRELLTYMIEDPRYITPCTHLLFGAKNIERIGDHATNVAETVHYLVTGQTLRDDRPKRDATSYLKVEAGR
jgi:phosphate transport system protein